MPRSVRTYLIGMIAGVTLPLLVFSSVLVISAARHEQAITAESARHRTRLAAAAIQDQLASLRANLLLLAGTLSLQTSDLNEFHTRASNAFPGMAIVLSSASGQQIVNTRVPYGTPLPASADPEAIRRVAESLHAYVANLSVDSLTNRMAVTINVPVTRDSQLVYVLSLDISPALQGFLRELDLPDGWIATIFDRNGDIIARTRDPDRFVGQRARPEFISRVGVEEEGWISGFSREGDAVMTAFAHTKAGSWTIGVAIPEQLLLAPVRQTTADLLFLGGLTVAIAITLAALIGQRIAGPVMDLVPVASTVGRGGLASPGRSGLQEANAVGQSLVEASERLRREAAERRAVTESLRRLADDLARVDAERSELLTRMVAAQEDERRRIARELHDSLAQYLTAIRLELRASRGQIAPDATDPYDAVMGLVDQLAQAVNRMAWELRLVALDELGFSSAITLYLEEWAERAGLRVDTAIDLGGCQLPPVVETTLFRVLQEAATNVLRHARATRMAIILEIKGDEVRLIIEDDGTGFIAPEPALSPRQFGLVGMRERLALIHGVLDVESIPDHGTTLFIRVPLGQRLLP